MTLTPFDVDELQMILTQCQEALYLFREAEELPPVLLHEFFQNDSVGLTYLHEELQAISSPLERQLKFQRLLLEALETRLHSLPYLQPQPNMEKQRRFYAAHLQAMPKMHDSPDTCPHCGHQSEEHLKVSQNGPYHVHSCQKCRGEWTYYYWDVRGPAEERRAVI